jgi:hypothetical protein
MGRLEVAITPPRATSTSGRKRTLDENSVASLESAVQQRGTARTASVTRASAHTQTTQSLEDEDEEVDEVMSGDVSDGEKSDDLDNYLYVTPLRPDYDGGAVRVCRLGKGTRKRGDMTKEAKKNVIADLQYLEKADKETWQETWDAALSNHTQARRSASAKLPRSAAAIVGRWWCWDRSKVLTYAREFNKDASISPKKQNSGRKSKMTQQAQEDIRDEFNKTEGLVSVRKLSANLKGKGNWKTKYRGQTNDAPSMSTVARFLRRSDLKFKTMRMSHNLTAENVNIRMEFAKSRMDKTYKTFDVDEAYIVSGESRKRRKLMVLPFEGEEEVEKTVASLKLDFVGSTLHAPQIFLAGIVTGPEYELDKDGVPKFHPRRNGKVALLRIRAKKTRQRGRGDKKAGDAMFSNTTIDGNRYAEIMLAKGGFADCMAEYMSNDPVPPGYSTAKVLCADLESPFDAEKVNDLKTTKRMAKRMRIQEDGAPGHGYNNRWGGKESKVHEALVKALDKRNIELDKQPKHSPEMNKLDLGIWNALKSRVLARGAEVEPFTGSNHDDVESHLWRITKEEWDAMPPELFFNVAKAQEHVFQLIEEANGERVSGSFHSGVRNTYKTRND